MSYFYLQSKSYLLPYQTENIILAARLHLTVLIFTKHKICPLNKTICNYQCQISKTKLHTLSILININREYTVIPIIPIGGYLKLNINQFVYNTTT